MSSLDRYTTKVTPIAKGKGYWDYLRVEIFESDTKIGEYTRKYQSMFNTFVPFLQKREDGTVGEYALFSDDYTRTAVMELPSCQVIAAEPGGTFGFCPVDFYVPYEEPYDGGDYKSEGIPGRFGFVAGCIWGDDSSWKVEYLDLSRIREGIITRDSRFGYHELPDGIDLKDAVVMEFYERGTFKGKRMDDDLVVIARQTRFHLNEGPKEEE